VLLAVLTNPGKVSFKRTFKKFTVERCRSVFILHLQAVLRAKFSQTAARFLVGRENHEWDIGDARRHRQTSLLKIFPGLISRKFGVI
jgi:hypothetical protein